MPSATRPPPRRPRTPRVHPVAASFDRVADAYDRGRPEYPSEAIQLLVEGLELRPGRQVLDLAAGTGKLTRSLLPTGVDMVAVEPSAGMRATFERLTPRVKILDGTAEAIPLPSASVDAVVVGQAFHWFRADEALKEIGRVLRPAGGLGLVWNRRDEAVPWVAQLTRILDARDPGVPRTREEEWKGAFDRNEDFAPMTHHRVVHRQRLTRAAMEDRVASVSFIAALGRSEQAKVTAEVDRLLDSDPATAGRAEIVLPYVTDVYVTHRKADGIHAARASQDSRHEQPRQRPGLGRARPS